MDSGTAHSEGWQSGQEIMSKCRIGKVVTVGVLMGETDDTLYMALSYDPDHDHYFGAQAIQKANITKKVTLRER